MDNEYETSGMGKVWNLIKLVCALGVVALFLNGIMIKSKQGAELAKEMKSMFENTTQHTADANAVIDWASK